MNRRAWPVTCAHADSRALALPARPGRGEARVRGLLAAIALSLATTVNAESPPTPALFDAHVHYSHDAWEQLPPAKAVEILRKAGLRKVLVSSSSDDGTQLLAAQAPDLIVPSLRPYRTRGEIGTWVRDQTVIEHLESRLRRYRYVAIGEFHVYGADADLPVMRRVVALAREHGLVLHLHGDSDAVERVFRQDPRARVLWAHAGFDSPERVRAMLERFPRLWADLAFRSDPAIDGRVDPGWRAVFDAHPERIMLGTDTFTPERWHYVAEHAAWARRWLATLPPALAEAIGWRNAERLLVQESPVACAPEPGSIEVVSPSLRLWYRPVAGRIEAGKAFSLAIGTCVSDGTGPGPRVLAVDASMPAHRHGMNYRPRVVAEGNGGARADGLLLHMPGEWQFEFLVGAADAPTRITHRLDVR